MDGGRFDGVEFRGVGFYLKRRVGRSRGWEARSFRSKLEGFGEKERRGGGFVRKHFLVE